MTAHSRIHAAEKAISTARLSAGWSSDGDHQCAVELEARGLLTSAEPKPTLPSTVYVVRAYVVPHAAEGVYLSDAAAEAAAHVIAGEGANTHPQVGNFTMVCGPHGGIRASINALPLHTDDTPGHGLPVVGVDAVADALDVCQAEYIYEAAVWTPCPCKGCQPALPARDSSGGDVR